MRQKINGHSAPLSFLYRSAPCIQKGQGCTTIQKGQGCTTIQKGQGCTMIQKDNTFGMANSKVCFDLMPKLPLHTLSKYMNTTGYYNAVIV